MSLGIPFQPSNSGGVTLGAVNTATASNTTWPNPQGNDVWVANPNSTSVVFVYLSNTATNSSASPTQGVPIAPNCQAILKGPWPTIAPPVPPGTISATNSGNVSYPVNTAIISAILASGGNTSALYAAVGYGSAGN